MLDHDVKVHIGGGYGCVGVRRIMSGARIDGEDLSSFFRDI